MSIINSARDADLYPHGTSYTVVIEEERRLREEAEHKINGRLREVEERLCIVDAGSVALSVDYPDLVKAYKKFKKEESKMKTFEALKNSA